MLLRRRVSALLLRPLLLLMCAPLDVRAASMASARPDAGPSVTVAPGVTGLTAAGVHAADAATTERVQSWVRSASSGWTPNLGQLAGSNGRATPSALYSMTLTDAQLLVTPRGVSVYFRALRDDREAETREQERPEKQLMDWSRLDVVLEGADIRRERALAEQPLVEQGEQNFYAPHCPDGVLHVPSYARVTFRDVYPGIDWILTSEPGRPVHQDFLVHPGADPGRIRLRYRGAKDIRLGSDARTLRVRTALGEIQEGPLCCYQRGAADTVGARFRLDRNLLTVKLNTYDRTAPLTIDPPLVWSTLYGGSNYDGPKSIYCDNLNGDVYVVGYTASSNLPCSTAVSPQAYFQGTNGGGSSDAFIWKFSQLGARRWATYYGGSGDDSGVDCTVDRLGNLYVVGRTASSNLPVLQLPGAYWQPANAGATDGFVLRFNSQGVRQWATYYGGNGNDFPTGITADSTNQVFVVGYGGSNNLPLRNPGGGAFFQPALNGGSDSFILRFNTLDSLVWATYHGGNSADEARGLAIDAGNLYVVGETYSTAAFPLVDPPGNADYFQGGFAGGLEDAFISRFTISGAQTWSTYYGGNGADEAMRPVIDASGKVYVCGTTNSTDLPVFNPNPIATPNQPAYFQGVPGGGIDLFLLEFSPANVRTWATYFGGNSSEDFGRGQRPLALDAQGRLHLTGATSSPNFPLANPLDGSYYAGTTTGGDVFYASFTTSDSLEWSTFFGGGGNSFGTGISFGVGDCLFGTGEFAQGAGFNTPPVNPPLVGTWFRSASSGNDDGFITKFCFKRLACCQGLTCVPVATAAECTALDGTAFYPNQTCAQTVCSILCTICGTKFADLNRNGIQDNGELSLAGWTVELRYPNGALYASAVTGPSGQYCFNSVPCGPWLVTEAPQAGWVKVAPAGSGYPLSLQPATTQNGLDFGNYSCPTPPPCSSVPPGIVAWWPFDDGPGAMSAMDVTHATPARNAAVLVGAASSGSGTLCTLDPSSYGRVPLAAQTGLDLGTRSFGISVWLRPASSTATGRVVVEKHDPATSGGVKGWSLYLDGMQLKFMQGAGSTPQIIKGPVIPAGSWSYVAVSIDRTLGQGRWYLNGIVSTTLDFVPAPGSVTSDGNLVMGQTDPANGAGPGLQGCLGQLALFGTPISAEVASKAYGPGPGTGPPVAWCPDYALLPAARTICANNNTVQVCFNIVNSSGLPVTYSWALTGSPAGPGCSNAGPTQFNPSAGTMLVPAGSVSATACVTITRPPGFTLQGATACYALTFVNQTTGVCRTALSNLKVDNSCWCAGAVALARIPPSGLSVSIGVKLPCDPISALPYRVVPRWPDASSPDPHAVSLDGLAPGSILTGSLSAGPGLDATLPVLVNFPHGYDPAAIYELALEADPDGDGTFETLASTFVASSYGADGTTGVPGGTGPVGREQLFSSPNPFLTATRLGFTLAEAQPVTLEVYDFSGRIVRSLVRGWLEAGTRSVVWDGRDNGGRRVAPGIYLARLRTNARTQNVRLVLVR